MSSKKPSKKNQITRRKFVHHSASIAAAGTLASVWSNTMRAESAHNDINSQIRVAIIGLHGRGRSHIAGLAPHVVALCDCDESILAKRADEFEKKYGRKVEQVVDYRKLLDRDDRDDIDAVSIATPNHTHSLIGIAAAQAGKHVYCEKPISHTVWEGRQLVNAADKHKVIMQCGTQARSSIALGEAAHWVQNGGLGKIQYALGTCYKPRPGIGKLQQPLEIPSSVNYDLWCGPAEMVDLYRSRLHYDWHWDFNTGAGDMGNQGIHQMDIARWFLGHKTLSPRVISVGGRLGYEDAGNTPNTQVVLHDYPEAPILFETRGLPKSKADQKNWGSSMDEYRGSRIGVIIQCEKGYVLVPTYENAIAYDQKSNEIKRWSAPKGYSILGRHFENFISAVRSGDASQLNCPVVEGHISSALCHTGNISHQLGTKLSASEIADQVQGNDLLASSVDRMMYHLRMNEVDVDQPVVTLGESLEMDPVSEQFTNNEKADQMLRVPARKPFVVPTVEVS